MAVFEDKGAIVFRICPLQVCLILRNTSHSITVSHHCPEYVLPDIQIPFPRGSRLRGELRNIVRAPTMFRQDTVFCEDLVLGEDLEGLRHSAFIGVPLHILGLSITIFLLLMKQAPQLR